MKTRESLSTRLSTAIALMMVVMVAIISLAFFWRVNKAIRQEAERTAFSELKFLTTSIDNVLGDAEDMCRDLAPVIAEDITSRNHLSNIIQCLVRDNEAIQSCEIVLAPGVAGDRFSVFACRITDDSTLTGDLTDYYDYTTHVGFTAPRDSAHGIWHDPYYEEISHKQMICAYSHPIYNHEGSFIGVVSVSLGTEWINTLVNSIRPYDHSYNILVDRNGLYMAHPDSRLVLKKTVLDRANERDDKVMKKVFVEEIQAGHIGKARVKRPDGHLYCFYAPIARLGWRTAIFCPYQDIYPSSIPMIFFVGMVIIIFYIILVIVVNTIVKRQLQPLNEFADMVRNVAVSEFNAPLPIKTANDEMFNLYESFEFLQHALEGKINELKESSDVQERMEGELYYARQLQLDMVPCIFPAFPDRKDIDVYAILNPSREVGGNLYDFALCGDKVYFAIGDVSDKGLPSAIFMSMAFKLLRMGYNLNNSPAKIISDANKAMSTDNGTSQFVTLFVCLLDLKTGELTYCNAGQDEPMLINPDGTVATLPVESNVPVGLMADMKYAEQRTPLAPGTKVVLYTDGVVELTNQENVLYGSDRLKAQLEGTAAGDCQQIITKLKDDVIAFSANTANDDVTALAFCYRPKTK